MVRHSAVVYRTDCQRQQEISFSNPGWFDYTPLLQPGTIAVTERLPEGSAAVLINRNHTYRDIYLPITSGQRKLYDQIDGKRPIYRIIDTIAGARASKSLVEAVRLFFEHLWRYDQILIDGSNIGNGGK
jgi:hypothetical protein